MMTLPRALCAVAAALVLLSATAVNATAPTPPPSGTFCGNGLLDAGESCATCADDCVVRRCQPQGAAAFAVHFAPPEQGAPSSVTVRIGYRSELLALPGSGITSHPRQRIAPTSKAVLVVNDLDYALRVVASSGTRALPAGELLTIRFDGCRAARPPRISDLSCGVESCTGRHGIVKGCGCSVVAVPAPAAP